MHGSDQEGMRREIETLYTRHNPAKLVEVDTLLEKYGERKLLNMVRKKYVVGMSAAPLPSTSAVGGDGGVGGGSDMSELRMEIERLYSVHNPAKLTEVDTLIQKYGETRLVAMIRKKYGLPSAAHSSAEVKTKPPMRTEIESLYAIHNPSKLTEVDALVTKYGEARLLAMIKKKYNIPTGGVEVV